MFRPSCRQALARSEAAVTSSSTSNSASAWSRSARDQPPASSDTAGSLVATLLPDADVQARIAAEPRDALINHVWLQEHRAVSAGRGLGAGNGPMQQITLTK